MVNKFRSLNSIVSKHSTRKWEDSVNPNDWKFDKLIRLVTSIVKRNFADFPFRLKTFVNGRKQENEMQRVDVFDSLFKMSHLSSKHVDKTFSFWELSKTFLVSSTGFYHCVIVETFRCSTESILSTSVLNITQSKCSWTNSHHRFVHIERWRSHSQSLSSSFTWINNDRMSETGHAVSSSRLFSRHRTD